MVITGYIQNGKIHFISSKNITQYFICCEEIDIYHCKIITFDSCERHISSKDICLKCWFPNGIPESIQKRIDNEKEWEWIWE